MDWSKGLFPFACNVFFSTFETFWTQPCNVLVKWWNCNHIEVYFFKKYNSRFLQRLIIEGLFCCQWLIITVLQHYIMWFMHTSYKHLLLREWLWLGDRLEINLILRLLNIWSCLVGLVQKYLLNLCPRCKIVQVIIELSCHFQ